MCITHNKVVLCRESFVSVTYISTCVLGHDVKFISICIDHSQKFDKTVLENAYKKFSQNGSFYKDGHKLVTSNVLI